MKEINFHGFTGLIEIGYYGNKRYAVSLVSYDGEPIARCTVNVPEIPLHLDEVIIKDYADNEGMMDCLVSAGIVTDTRKRVLTGHVRCPIGKFTPEFHEWIRNKN